MAQRVKVEHTTLAPLKAESGQADYRIKELVQNKEISIWFNKTLCLWYRKDSTAFGQQG
jgi:hypothetical protein